VSKQSVVRGVLTFACSFAVTLSFGAATSPAALASGGTAQNGFSTPLLLPGSDGFGEPSLTIGNGRLVATAPSGLLTSTTNDQPSPVWVSTNAGGSFAKYTPAIAGLVAQPLGGGDADVTMDAAGDIFQTDLWLGDTTMRVSTDGGQSWLSNEAGHSGPGDDRPWLGYSGKDASLYVVYDGFDALHVARASLAAGPLGGIAFVQDVAAVPECLIGNQYLVHNNKPQLKLANPCYQGTPVTVRQCVCPPGGIAVDPTTGSVYITYSRQNGAAGGGVGVARSDDLGLTWSYFSIPGTGSTGSAFDTEWNFDPVRVDAQGNVYVSWGEVGKNGSVQIRFSLSKDHGQTWSTPVRVSTSTATNVFPTMDLLGPGQVDIAYYGTSTPGDPNDVNASWNVYLAKSTNALSATPSFSPKAAVAGIHTGAIESSNESSDRSLLDFFQLAVDPSGKANIVYTAGQEGPPNPLTGLSTRLTDLFFVKEL
jgi:hypothetical protein